MEINDFVFKILICVPCQLLMVKSRENGLYRVFIKKNSRIYCKFLSNLSKLRQREWKTVEGIQGKLFTMWGDSPYASAHLKKSSLRKA